MPTFTLHFFTTSIQNSFVLAKLPKASPSIIPRRFNMLYVKYIFLVNVNNSQFTYCHFMLQIRVAVLRLLESVLTKISGRPQSINILYYQQHKGEATSCASNVRLINGSPSQTTVQCCPSSNGATTTTALAGEGRKVSTNSHIHLMVCDQVSSL